MKRKKKMFMILSKEKFLSPFKEKIYQIVPKLYLGPIYAK